MNSTTPSPSIPPCAPTVSVRLLYTFYHMILYLYLLCRSYAENPIAMKYKTSTSGSLHWCGAWYDIGGILALWDNKFNESHNFLINSVTYYFSGYPVCRSYNPLAPKCQPVATMQKQSCVLQQRLSHRFRKSVLVVSQLKLSVKHLLLRRQMQRSIPWYHSSTGWCHLLPTFDLRLIKETFLSVFL